MPDKDDHCLHPTVCWAHFALDHRHYDGAVCIRPVAASHGRADRRRLHVRQLRHLFHWPAPVCREHRCVCAPAAASPQEDTRPSGMKLFIWRKKKAYFLPQFVNKLTDSMEIPCLALKNNHFFVCMDLNNPVPVIYMRSYCQVFPPLWCRFKSDRLDGSKSSIFPDDWILYESTSLVIKHSYMRGKYIFYLCNYHLQWCIS